MAETELSDAASILVASGKVNGGNRACVCSEIEYQPSAVPFLLLLCQEIDCSLLDFRFSQCLPPPYFLFSSWLTLLP